MFPYSRTNIRLSILVLFISMILFRGGVDTHCRNFVAVVRYSSCLPFRLLACPFITFYPYMCWYPYQANFFLLYLSVLFPCLPFSGSFHFFLLCFYQLLGDLIDADVFLLLCCSCSLFLSTCVLWYLMCFLNWLGLRLVYLCSGFCPFLILRELLSSL
jgi:hypothetical protein